MFRRSLAVLAALLAVALTLLGANASARRPAAEAPEPGAFPVTIAAANGKITLERQPRRIISLSPTATESLFAIGAGRQVIAVDDQSDYPANAPKTKLSGFTPNAEAVAGYRPDLVVLSFDTKGIVKSLGKLRIPVLVQPAPSTLSGAYAQIEQLGLATGQRRGAAGLVKRMRARIGSLVASVPQRSKALSVYHELGPDYFSATSSTFIGRVYGLFGLRNIADEADKSGSGYPQLSAEYILAANPDLIVLSDVKCCAQSPTTVAARPGWDRLTAVKNRAIVRIDDSIASRWGPRIVNFVRAVAQALTTTGG